MRVLYLILVLACTFAIAGCSGASTQSSDSDGNQSGTTQEVESGTMLNKQEQRIRTQTIAVGNLVALGVKNDGTAVSAGKTSITGGYEPVFDLSGWKDIVSVAITTNSSCAFGVREDGTVATTEPPLQSGSWYEWLNDVSEWTDIVKIAAGDDYVIGLRRDGTICAAGHTMKGTKDAVANWKDIVDITANSGFNFAAVMSDGTAKVIGRNTSGECDVNSWTDIVQIAPFFNSTLGLKSDGTIVSTSPNVERGFSLWNDYVYIAGNGQAEPYAVRSNGELVACELDGTLSDALMNDVAEIADGGWGLVTLQKDGTATLLPHSSRVSKNSDRHPLFTDIKLP